MNKLACWAMAALLTAQAVGKVELGGNTSPDGKTEVACDLPVSQRVKNVGGRDGAGLCVFSSLTQSARYQNERRLTDFQQKMRSENGGGWPAKVDAMVAKYGPGTGYIQYEGNDPDVLKLALATGRMPCVTYNGFDPHYGQQAIAHMVNLVAYDNDHCAVLDNNFIGADQIVWLSETEFLKRWRGGGSGWAVVLLAPPPPPPPRN